MRRSNEHANASRKAYFPLGREQRIESGDTAFSYNRNIHTTQDRGLLLRSLVPGKISEVVCFIEGPAAVKTKSGAFSRSFCALSLSASRPVVMPSRSEDTPVSVSVLAIADV